MNCSLVTHGQSLRDMHAQLFSVGCGSWIIFLAKVIYRPVESLISFGCSDVSSSYKCLCLGLPVFPMSLILLPSSTHFLKFRKFTPFML